MKRSRTALMVSAIAFAFFLSLFAATPVRADLDFTIARVWTSDCQGQDTTVFSPGQCIRYRVSINNGLGETVKTEFTFDAYPTGPHDYREKRIYYWDSLAHNTQVPVNTGTQYFYSQPNVPASASPGSYTFTINVLTLYPSPSASVEETAEFMVREG